ncbi:hydrolase phosphatase [Marmoricola endophyticus]|uniref:Hydrolase phosphatase n=1 Tax=Marmoricola endophyticus TaxID=2040280 RepID=A0A917BGQ4_9ACTN|nr:HAD-IA family hydrolase [Marmoricola endophyticus]GGF42686.1 hydrolase phosphatase [Marmoricola endophyticus]
MTAQDPLDLRSYDLVIFDNDGVLVDSETLTVEVEQQLLAELGWEMSTAEVVARFMGRSLAAEVAEVGDRLGADVGARFGELLVERCTQAYADHLAAVAGVPELLDRLAVAGVPTCVASSGTPEGIAAKLERTGLAAHFGDRVSSAVEVEHGKPAPDLFLLAARKAGADPARCVVVEDSVAGVTGAVAAGTTALAYGGSLAPRAELEAAGGTWFARMSDLRISARPPRGV